MFELHIPDNVVRLRSEQLASDEAFMEFCARNEPLRIERDANGELIIMSPTGTEGGGAELDIGTDLNLWARQDGRGKALGPNSGVKLPDGSVRAADAAWISWTRYNAVTPEQQKGFAPVCPEFVIEVRSASDRLPELQDKLQMWIANGAELAWLIDPTRKAVEIYRPGREPEVLEGGSTVEGEGSVAGFVLELGKVWG
jgi:Uma2 family endonuclease